MIRLGKTIVTKETVKRLNNRKIKVLTPAEARDKQLVDNAIGRVK